MLSEQLALKISHRKPISDISLIGSSTTTLSLALPYITGAAGHWLWTPQAQISLMTEVHILGRWLYIDRFVHREYL